MSVEIKVPILPESVSEATVATWHKKVGDAVKIDENIVDIETEKVVLEVPSTVDGVIKELRVEEGATVGEQEIIAIIEEGAAAQESAAAEESTAAKEDKPTPSATSDASDNADDADKLSPAVRKMLAESNVDASAVKGTGKNGRILKEDVQNHLKTASSEPKASAASSSPAPKTAQAGERGERRQQVRAESART